MNECLQTSDYYILFSIIALSVEMCKPILLKACVSMCKLVFMNGSYFIQSYTHNQFIVMNHKYMYKVIL